MTLHYVSLFSGIEAFSVAASRIRDVDWRPVFFSEIDPFPCAVLAHHFPTVPNLGDICKIKIDHANNTATNGSTTVALPGAGIDILAGGSPCQDVSVAGKRAGMSEGSGTRSSLAFEYTRLVRELRPRVILWENVPGVLSSNGGHDFAAFLHSLDELGYSLAWRVLDCQYTRVDSAPMAVPQRRRRVWLVGCLGGDASVLAQILFERAGLLGDTPPRREAGQGFAAPAGYGPARNDRVVEGTGFGETGQGFWQSGIQTLRADHQGVNWPSNVAVSILRRNPPEYRTGSVAAHTLSAHTVMDGMAEDLVVHREQQTESASFDGEDVSPTLHKPNGAPGYSDEEVFSQKGAYLARVLDMSHADEVVREVDGGAAPTLQSRMGTGGNQVPIVCTEPSVCKTLSAEGFDGMPDIQKGNGQPVVAVGFCPEESAKTRSVGAHCETSQTLNTASVRATAIGFKPGRSPGGEGAVATRHIVRRLTPGECETLQFFPQGYTRIPYRGKPADQCPDSPRYKALGNSWATNCAEWILRRVVAAFRLGMC